MTTQELIEQRAAELKEWYTDHCPVPHPYHEFFNELAIKVLSLEIKARLNELEIVKNIPGRELYLIDEPDNLREQLKELEQSTTY